MTRKEFQELFLGLLDGWMDCLLQLVETGEYRHYVVLARNMLEETGFELTLGSRGLLSGCLATKWIKVSTKEADGTESISVCL